MSDASSTGYRSIEQVDVAGKAVFVRVDFNVPMADDGSITDDRRIASTVPTLRRVLDHGGKLILASHLGRPQGIGYEKGMSLKPVAKHLQELLGQEVLFPSRDCVDEAAAQAVAELAPGGVIVLENTRFHKAEKKGDVEFAKQLARYGDVYCNEAFGASHRADASMVALPTSMRPRPCVAGLLLEKEIHWLRDVVSSAGKPFVAILGGAKISDKLGAIRHLAGNVDTLLVGGAMAFTLLKALGHSVGKSLVEESMVQEAAQIIAEVEKTSTRLLLPSDFVCGEEPNSETSTSVSGLEIPDGMMGLDIGPASAEEFSSEIRTAKTVVWNGPMGLFEAPPFDEGTRKVAEAVGFATRAGAATIAGGGDTAAAIHDCGLDSAFSHISTGGGASLQMLEGRPLPGLEVLDRKI